MHLWCIQKQIIFTVSNKSLITETNGDINRLNQKFVLQKTGRENSRYYGRLNGHNLSRAIASLWFVYRPWLAHRGSLHVCTYRAQTRVLVTHMYAKRAIRRSSEGAREPSVCKKDAARGKLSGRNEGGHLPRAERPLSVDSTRHQKRQR